MEMCDILFICVKHLFIFEDLHVFGKKTRLQNLNAEFGVRRNGGYQAHKSHKGARQPLLTNTL